QRKRLRLSLRAPAQIGGQRKVAAVQHGRQKVGQLQPVLLRGGEEAHRPVELEAIRVWPERLHVADEPMELDEPEQSSQLRRRMSGDDRELAAVFEQLDQTLL